MKHLTAYFLSLFFIAFLVCGCHDAASTGKAKDSTAGFDLVAAQKSIDAENGVFAKAFITGDSAAMVNHYTADGKIFPPNADMVAGRSGIAALVSEYLKYGIKEFIDSSTALYGNEENLIEEGTFFMGDGKNNTIDKGKYICVWRKVNGEWKAYSDIFNTSIPQAAVKK